MRFHVALAVVAAAAPLSAQDTLAAGLEAGLALNPGGALITLSGGSYLTYDGATVELHAAATAAGSAPIELFAFDPPVFSGAFAVDPSETHALVGESTNGGIYRVALDGSGGTLLATLPFNFDAAFESASSALVSAATCGFSCGTDLVRVDVLSGASATLAILDGASGPLAVSEQGDVYYATLSGDFPAPEGSTSILRFSGARLAAGALLGEADAELVAAGFDGASSLAFEDGAGRAGAVFLAESSFGTGVNRIHRVDADSGAAHVLVEGPAFQWIAGLELDPGAGDGVFFPFQPDGNGVLHYTRTDFFSYDERLTLAPTRPELELVGSPGPTGGSSLSAHVSGGSADGVFALFAAPAELLLAEELTYDFGGLPLVHSALFAPLLARVDALGALNADGAGTLIVPVPPGLSIPFALQAIVLDDSGVAGSSDTEIF